MPTRALSVTTCSPATNGRPIAASSSPASSSASSSVAGSGRPTANSAPGQPRDQPAAAVARTRQPLDPPRYRSDDRIADAAPECRIDHVEAAEADHDEDRPLPARQPRLDPAACTMAVLEPGQRIARGRVRSGVRAVERLDMTDDDALLEHQMMRDPPPVLRIVRERRDAALVAQPPDRVQRGAHAGRPSSCCAWPRVSSAVASGRPARLRQRRADRQRRGALGRPAPRHRLARDQPRAARGGAMPAREPFGMTRGETQRLRELALGERRGQIMRRAGLVSSGDRGGLAAPDQQQQRRAIGLHRVRQHPRRGQPLGQRIARVDHRQPKRRWRGTAARARRCAAPRSPPSPRARPCARVRRAGGTTAGTAAPNRPVRRWWWK